MSPRDQLPQIFAGRLITSRFLDQLVRYLESLSGVGRSPGLLRPRVSQWRSVPYLESPDLLKIDGILAIGMNGHVIDAEPGDEAFTPTLDVQGLPAGDFPIYVVLLDERVPTGGLSREAESPYAADGHEPAEYREYLASRVLLTEKRDQPGTRDWLKLGEISRTREGGFIRTHLNPDFHPLIRDMGAYQYPNPLRMLGEHVLTHLEDVDGDAVRSLLRGEALLLRGIAESGSAEHAFMVANRVLHLIASAKLPQLLLAGEFQGMTYSPETLPRFLAALRRALEDSARGGGLFPASLEIDGVAYRLLDGSGLVEAEDYFEWAPPQTPFVANQVAVYVPLAPPGSLPGARFRHAGTNQGHFSVAHSAGRVAGPGCALLLGPWSTQCQRLQLSADSAAGHDRLRRYLEDGCRAYYA